MAITFIQRLYWGKILYHQKHLAEMNTMVTSDLSVDTWKGRQKREYFIPSF